MSWSGSGKLEFGDDVDFEVSPAYDTLAPEAQEQVDAVRKASR